MAHPLLFIPEKQGQDPAMLEELGLTDLVAGAEFIESEAGPEGKPGVIVGWLKPGQPPSGHTRLHYAPEEQTWLKAVPVPGEGGGDARGVGLPAGRYWIGIWNDSPPAPKDMQRPYAIPGHWMRLGDDNDWLIPNANELPADRILADDGTWKFEIQRKYHNFYLEVERFRHVLREATPETTLDYAELDAFNLRALRLNYRILPELVSHLRLFNKQNIHRIMFAFVGALQAQGHPVEGPAEKAGGEP